MASNRKPAAARSVATHELAADGEYAGENPAQLAAVVERALQERGSGEERRQLHTITFFEGELRLIARALRQVSIQVVKFTK